MKRLFFRSRRVFPTAFTLVELLVVIAIIAILAGVLLSAGTLAIQAANRAKASNTASQIQTACLNYYTEYSVYPIASTYTASTDVLITDAATDAGNWQNLIYCLSGNLRPSAPGTTISTGVPNSRSIAFLTLKASDVGTTASGYPDAPLNPIGSTTNLFFNIAMDGDYSGVMGDSTSGVNGKLPNFTKSTITAMDYTGTTTTGIGVWENCNPSPAKTNPGWWVHTY
jgi:prepilin-type N-terminal cleavage/methylation domain-containing protein